MMKNTETHLKVLVESHASKKGSEGRASPPLSHVEDRGQSSMKQSILGSTIKSPVSVLSLENSLKKPPAKVSARGRNNTTNTSMNNTFGSTVKKEN